MYDTLSKCNRYHSRGLCVPCDQGLPSIWWAIEMLLGERARSLISRNRTAAKRTRSGFTYAHVVGLRAVARSSQEVALRGLPGNRSARQA